MKIKRILFIISFSALAGLYLLITMPKNVVYTSLALFIVFILIHGITSKRYTYHLILALISVMSFATYFNMYSNRLMTKISKYDNVDNIQMRGQVVSVKDYEGADCFTIKVNAFNNNKIDNFKVNLYTSYPLKQGEYVNLTGKYKSFTHKTNFIYNYSKGIYGYFYADKIIVEKNVGYNTTNLFSFIRIKLINETKRLYGDSYLPIVLALGLGDKDYIDDEVNISFNVTGITHALSVSGLHVGIIISVVLAVMKYIPLKKKVKNIIACIFIIAFMGIIGYTPSVVRAGILAICVLLGRNFIVEIDNYTVLAVIVLISLILNPYSSANASLLLSYSAYFGVIYAVQIAQNKNMNNVLSMMLMSRFAVLFSSPFLSMLGMTATFMSPVFNLVLSPFIYVVCVCSFFGAVLACFTIFEPVIRFIIVPINKIAITIILSFSDFAKKYFDFALLNMADDRIKVIVFTVLVVVLIAYIQFNSVKIRRIFVVTVSLLVVLCYTLLSGNTVKVRAFDSGSETSFILTHKSKNYMILAENISEKRLNQIISYESIDNVTQIVYCPEKYTEPERIKNVTNQIFTISESGIYDFNGFVIDANIASKHMSYTIKIGNTSILFSHKSAKLGDEDYDFYFFGSDTPKEVKADNIYYFYPLLKRHTEIVQSTGAYQLFDTITLKINSKNGKYRVIEDVKNFGS